MEYQTAFHQFTKIVKPYDALMRGKRLCKCRQDIGHKAAALVVCDSQYGTIGFVATVIEDSVTEEELGFTNHLSKTQWRRVELG